jgi:hypothetical protein
MRILIAILCLFLLSHPQVFGQEAEVKKLSNAELFSAKSGILIEKQFIDIGKIKGVKVQVLTLKDLNDGISTAALRLEYDYKSTYSIDTKVASLDSDEIDGLIKSIKNLQTKVITATRDIYTEVTYKSRTGFEAGAFYDVDKKEWATYIRLSKFDSKSTVYLEVSDFSVFLDLVEQAKAKMK